MRRYCTSPVAGPHTSRSRCLWVSTLPACITSWRRMSYSFGDNLASLSRTRTMRRTRSTTRAVTALPVMIEPFGLRRDRGAWRGHRQGDGEHRAGAILAIARYDRSAHRLDEAAADGEAEPGAGALPVGAPDAVELLEDMREMLGWDAAAFVENLDHQA